MRSGGVLVIATRGRRGTQTAAQLGISPETVGREWRRAKAWLYKELQSPGGEA